MFLRRMEKTLLVLTIGGTIAWGAATNLFQGASFLVGAVIAFANIMLLRRVAGVAVARAAEGEDPNASLSMMYLLKIVIIGLLIFALITLVRAHTPSIALGLSIVPVAILFEFLRWNITAPHADAETR
jgi:multisubunit Na+/H+ antiporter MnhE subunit